MLRTSSAATPAWACWNAAASPRTGSSPGPRDFVLLVLGPGHDQPLVEKYRDPATLRAAVPHGERVAQLPRLPFIGKLSYADVRRVLRERLRWYSRPERTAIALLDDYLALKEAACPRPARRPWPVHDGR